MKYYLLKQNRYDTHTIFLHEDHFSEFYEQIVLNNEKLWYLKHDIWLQYYVAHH